MTCSYNEKRTSIYFNKPQVSPEIVDPRKVDTNFLEANFEYFRVLEARGDI